MMYKFYKKLKNITSDVKFDIYGLDRFNQWADHYLKLSLCKDGIEFK